MTPPTAPDPDALLTEFLRTSRAMVAAQRDVLLAYLGAAPVVPPRPSPVPALPAAAPALSAPAVSAPAVSAAPVPVAAAPPPGSGKVMDAVLGIISERTGYPVDLIEPDLDLEADLSVDSIKRTEIAGELAARLGAGRDAARLDGAELEDLA